MPPKKEITTPINPSNGCLPLEWKQDKLYQKHIATLTLADAEHDLGDVLSQEFSKKGSTLLQTFNDGIPYSVTRQSKTSEAMALASVFGGEQKWKDTVPDVTTSIVKQPGILKTRLETMQTGSPIFVYDAVKFCIKAHDPFTPPSRDFGKTFVENTKLGGNGKEAAIIVDFSQHHFIEEMKKGADAGFTLHYLMTPEVVNDPAGKPNVHNETIFGNKTSFVTGFRTTPGVEFRSYVQSDPQPLTYTNFNEYEPNPSNNFFSKYQFTLSPIQQNFTNKKAEKFITTLNITYDNGEKKPLTNTVEDSKGENSNTTVAAYLRTLIHRIYKATDRFNFNSKCQQKRGGDWFQALACLDAKNRTYTQILPAGNRTQPFTLNKTCPVYLVTHDQIAVAFALSNGINVIYMDYYGMIYVFKNRADPAFAGSGKCLEEILFDEMKNNWIQIKDPEIGGDFLKNRINTATNYMMARETIITEQYNLFDQQVELFNNFISDNNKDSVFPNQTPILEFFNGLEPLIQNLFSQAVQLMFVETNLIDVQSEINFIKDNKDKIDWNKGFNEQTGSKEEFYDTINILSKNMNTIKGISDRFGLFAVDPDSKNNLDIDNLLNGIKNWITINVKKMNIYKLTKKFTIEYGESIVTQEPKNIFVKAFDKTKSFLGIASETFTRIKSITTQNRKIPQQVENKYETINYDKYLFLPFIKTLSKTDALVNCLNNLKKFLNEKIHETCMSVQDGARGRNGRSKLPPYIQKYNCLANFINDAMIILNIKQEPDIANTTNASENIIIPDSTDNIILEEDNAEITNINKSGKLSNNTDNDAEAVFVGGAKYNYFKTDNQRNVSTVINDISIKQFTWPLLTNMITIGFSETSLHNFIEQYKKVIPDPSSNYTIENDPYIQELRSQYENYRAARYVAEGIAPAVLGPGLAYVGLANPLVGVTVMGVGWVSGYVYEKYIAKKGGAEKDTSSASASEENALERSSVEEPSVEGSSVEEPSVEGSSVEGSTDLLKDFTFGYHPLVPIYMLLTSFYYTLGPKYDSHPFFYTYFTYINVLEKMVNVLDTNYLNDPLNNNNVIAAYLLGLTLSTFLFSSNTSFFQNNKILNVVGISQEDYYTFSLINDSFSTLITGAIHLTPDEEVLGFVLLDSELFKNFINKEVKIKEIIEQGTSETELKSYVVLKNRIENIMSQIVTKVNIDRGTPIDTANAVASGVKPSYEEIKAERLKKKAEEDEKTRAQQMEMMKKMQNLQTGRPNTMKKNRPESYTKVISSQSAGGSNKIRRMKSNRNKDKRKKTYTRKQKGSVKMITFTKKTKKHKRNHKRTKKIY